MGYKFNVFTGNFDIDNDSGASSSDDNFSLKKVDVAESKTIPENQQMLVDGHVTVLGHLTVLGELIDVSNRKPEQFFYDKINEDQCVEVDVNRLLLYKGHLQVNGHLRVNGRLEGV